MNRRGFIILAINLLSIEVVAAHRGLSKDSYVGGGDGGPFAKEEYFDGGLSKEGYLDGRLHKDGYVDGELSSQRSYFDEIFKGSYFDDMFKGSYFDDALKKNEPNDQCGRTVLVI